MLRQERSFMLFGLAANERSWRGLRLLIIVYLGSLLFAAITSPWVYKAVIWWFEQAPNSLNTYLAYKGFEDYFDRLRWIPIVLGLPWVMGQCRLWSLKRLGLSFEPAQRKRMRRWFWIGFALIGIVAGAQWHFTPSSFKEELSIWVMGGILLKALAGGLLLGFLEEVVFRGLILRLFYTAGGPILAVIIGSLFFAYVHFKMPDSVWQNAYPSNISSAEAEVYEVAHGQPPPEDLKRVNAGSGFFVALWTVIGITVDFQPLKFANLFMLGLVLNLLTLRTYSLMPAIGLHAGLVFAMLSFSKLSADVETTVFFGSSAMVDGVLPLILLGTLALFLLTVGSEETPMGRDY